MHLAQRNKTYRFIDDDLASGVDWAAFDWAVNSGAGKPA